MGVAKKQKPRNQRDFEVLFAFGGLLAEEEGNEPSAFSLILNILCDVDAGTHQLTHLI